jgi:uncharacterized protein YprB with RNaseH-like and TPR domain
VDASPGPWAVETVLDGCWRQDGSGRCLAIERRFAADVPYGRFQVGEFWQTVRCAAADASLLTSGAPKLPFVFFDLETTGLSGGAGTCAFLAGCGWFDEDGGFVTRQFLVTRPEEEPAMLSLLSSELRRAGTLVSFNGKAFDAPMLEMRYSFHRLDGSSVAGTVPHFDVLHPSRRFWGAFAAGTAADRTTSRSLSPCSLSGLEQQVLGVSRADDVAGPDIPARYFRYVRYGDARPLVAVAAHNRMDLLSLAGLTARLLRLVRNGAEDAAAAGEALALGRVYARGGFGTRARAAFERTLAIGGEPLLAIEALRALARNERQARRYDEASRFWREVLDVPECPPRAAREATEALAIHHEHRQRDLVAARAFALKTLEGGAHEKWADRARYRLARIERKMSARPLFR